MFKWLKRVVDWLHDLQWTMAIAELSSYLKHCDNGRDVSVWHIEDDMTEEDLAELFKKQAKEFTMKRNARLKKNENGDT